ncbi:hypothetical protein WH47_11971 [Habropoda laboriosa]|uniref:Uncharacterized protein n=1 Tax=Habropoda laboriosa TaxID=597456 RepID=A0A0L7R7P6_9HYME|nr:hypothetical protein WH47_11971 [Habropoda laboriosa]
MEQNIKRKKVTKESIVHDIASAVSGISESLISMNESYRSLLKVNRALVLFIQNTKKQQNLDNVQSDLEQATIVEEESE